MKPLLLLLAGLILTVGCGPADGPHTAYHANGKKKEEGAYRNGEKVGKWIYYWKSGAQKVEGSYRKGEQEGVWTFYNKNGKRIAQGTYKNGKMWDGTFVRYVFGTTKMMAYENGKEMKR